MGMTVRCASSILWHERMRYLPAVVAVGFSALLIAIQSGVLIGTRPGLNLLAARMAAGGANRGDRPELSGKPHDLPSPEPTTSWGMY